MKSALTNKQKLQAILNLLTDKNVAILQACAKEEVSGALIFATFAFSNAYKIMEGKKWK